MLDVCIIYGQTGNKAGSETKFTLLDSNVCFGCLDEFIVKYVWYLV